MNRGFSIYFRSNSGFPQTQMIKFIKCSFAVNLKNEKTLEIQNMATLFILQFKCTFVTFVSEHALSCQCVGNLNRTANLTLYNKVKCNKSVIEFYISKHGEFISCQRRTTKRVQTKSNHFPIHAENRFGKLR